MRLLLACLIVITQTVTAFADPKKVAVLVGVNKYDKPGFPALQFAERDVEQLALELQKLGFSRVIVLKGSGTKETAATRENILAQLSEAVKPLTQEDLILVMFSGHGQELQVKGDDGQIRPDNFYCPVGAVNRDPASQVSLSYVIDTILAPNVGRKLVLVDACRDAPKDPSRGSKGVQGRITTLPEDTAVFFSCRAGQRSFERPELQHGLFTYCVLEALRGEASQDHQVAWNDVVSHVSRRMSSPEIGKYFPEDSKQTPIPAGGVEHSILGLVKADLSKPMLTKAKSPSSNAKRPTVSKTNEPEKVVGKEDADQLSKLIMDALEKDRKAGELCEFNKELGLKMVWCPKGTFQMGTPDSTNDESPVEVTLTQGFWMGQTEVTQKQWESLMLSKPWQGKSGVRDGAKFPATHVNHADAVSFCLKLTDQERKAGRLPIGWKYALPTEAQWEYACRAGETTVYGFGDDPQLLEDYAWFNLSEFGSESFAHPVGRKQANGWGLHDMHGNVWEWCSDLYGEKLPGGDDPVGNSTGSTPVVRGGGWSNEAADCRSAIRYTNSQENRTEYLGFRLAAVPSSDSANAPADDSK